MTRALDRLLRPRSVAVIGGGAWCASVIRECKKIGFSGDVWPVHPSKTEIEGLPTFRGVDDLPAPPDASFVGVNRHATCEVIAALSRLGAGGAVCFASGFQEAVSELADGADLEGALLKAAGEMPILGPNCYGFINALDGTALWPDHHGMTPQDHGVAIITQSSNIALNLTMQRRGVPLAYLITAGNQAQIGLADIGISVLQDDRVTALGLYIEGVGDTAAFAEMAETARALGKPIVALKVGASDQAKSATITHTASLAGSDAGARALFKRLGVGQVHSLSTLLETLKLCHLLGPLPSNRIATLSCSGGEANLIADTALAHDVTFPALTECQSTALRAALGPKVALANPLDYHTYVWGDRDGMAACFRAVMDPGLALACVILDFPRADSGPAPEWDLVIDAMIDAQAGGRTPLALLASLPENLPEPVAARAMEAGILPLVGFDDALAAIATAAHLGQPVEAWHPLAPTPEGPSRTLTEADAKVDLAAHGMAVPRGARIDGIKDLPTACAALRFPVVLKAEGVAHKSDSGGVALGLTSAEAVEVAATAMSASRFLMEEMVPDGRVELLVGVTSDPAHGMVLTLGAGGTKTEIWGDTTSLLLPVTGDEIEDALGKLRIAPLFAGYRGDPPIDMPSLVAAILAVQDYVRANPGRIHEVEVNPLICTPDRAVAVDALIRLTLEETP